MSLSDWLCGMVRDLYAHRTCPASLMQVSDVTPNPVSNDTNCVLVDKRYAIGAVINAAAVDHWLQENPMAEVHRLSGMLIVPTEYEATLPLQLKAAAPAHCCPAFLESHATDSCSWVRAGYGSHRGSLTPQSPAPGVELDMDPTTADQEERTALAVHDARQQLPLGELRTRRTQHFLPCHARLRLHATSAA